VVVLESKSEQALDLGISLRQLVQPAKKRQQKKPCLVIACATIKEESKLIP
jgi:hypothetical protein